MPSLGGEWRDHIRYDLLVSARSLMLEALTNFIGQTPLAGLMAVIALGYALGRLGFRGIILGPAGGTLAIALLLSHFGLVSVEIEPAWATGSTLATFGFALFVYSVGFDAAPHFASGFGQNGGWRFITVAVVVNLVALASCVLGAKLLGLDAATAAGVLSGALTSLSTFASAAETLGETTRLSVVFGLTFPLGLVSLVFLIQVLPRLIHDDLAADAVSRATGTRAPQAEDRWTSRVFVVSNEAIIGQPLSQLMIPKRSGCTIATIHRATSPEDGSMMDSTSISLTQSLQIGERVVIPQARTELRIGDRLHVRGRVRDLGKLAAIVGRDQLGPELDDARLPARRIEVRNHRVRGKSLAELRLIDRHHCVITQLERGTLTMEPRADLRLRMGDVVELVGRRADLRAVGHELGRLQPESPETDIAVYAAGVCLGVLIGSVEVPMMGYQLGLGMAGGLLLVGTLLGVMRRVGSWNAMVPRPARQLVRDLGIMLFVAETGIRAGAGLESSSFDGAGPILVLAVVVLCTAVLSALFVARRLLRMRSIDAWGSICGGMTSSAALQTARTASDSQEVAVSYAAAYAAASVLATLAGPLVTSFVQIGQ